MAKKVDWDPPPEESRADPQQLSRKLRRMHSIMRARAEANQSATEPEIDEYMAAVYQLARWYIWLRYVREQKFYENEQKAEKALNRLLGIIRATGEPLKDRNGCCVEHIVPYVVKTVTKKIGDREKSREKEPLVFIPDVDAPHHAAEDTRLSRNDRQKIQDGSTIQAIARNDFEASLLRLLRRLPSERQQHILKIFLYARLGEPSGWNIGDFILPDTDRGILTKYAEIYGLAVSTVNVRLERAKRGFLAVLIDEWNIAARQSSPCRTAVRRWIDGFRTGERTYKPPGKCVEELFCLLQEDA